MPQHLYLPLMTAVLWSGVAALFDAKSRRIPNWLSASGFIAGLFLHLGIGGVSGIADALAAGFVAGAVFFVFFLSGGMGAGDVKLIAALASLMGLHYLVSLLVLTAITGGVMAIFVAFRHNRLRQTLSNVGAIAAHHGEFGVMPHPEFNLTRQNLSLPYAVPMAAGCILTMLLAGVHR